MWRHGTRYAYCEKKCRCAECVAAQAEGKRKWREKRTPAYVAELERNRARKRTYIGVCESCGGETKYNGGKNKQVSRLCDVCAHTFTHCKRGHLLTPENRLDTRNGAAYACRLCRNEQQRLRSAAKRRAAGVPERAPYKKRTVRVMLEAQQSEGAAPK